MNKKLSDYFGIELTSIDLSKKFSDIEIEDIKQLFQDNHLIVFRNQSLTDNQQLKFRRVLDYNISHV